MAATKSSQMKVAIAGIIKLPLTSTANLVEKASGLLGPYIVNALRESQRYSLSILKRTGSAYVADRSLNVIEVDYESEESLRLALQGHRVLISVLGKAALSLQPRLTNAAVAAGVERIIPSEFGSDLQNPKMRSFPTYGLKVFVEDLLERHRAHSGVSYTLIYNNTLLDWAISSQGRFLLDPVNRTISIFDGGNQKFSTTTMATVGRAVLGVLDNYEVTANRAVYVQDACVTQNEIFDMAKEATAGDDKCWTVSHVSTLELEAKAQLGWESGGRGLDIFYGFVARGTFSVEHGCLFSKLDNSLLGIEEMGKQELRDLVRQIVLHGKKWGVS